MMVLQSEEGWRIEWQAMWRNDNNSNKRNAMFRKPQFIDRHGNIMEGEMGAGVFWMGR
jgi:hypothetical protein